MSQVDVVIATGGMGMVKSAYIAVENQLMELVQEMFSVL